MSIRLRNCRVTIYRQNPVTQVWQAIVTNVVGNLQQSQQGAILEPPWFPSASTDAEASHLTHFKLFIDGVYGNVVYTPEPGDEIIITGTQMLNGTYQQIATGETHEGAGVTVALSYIKMPLVRVSMSTIHTSY